MVSHNHEHEHEHEHEHQHGASATSSTDHERQDVLRKLKTAMVLCIIFFVVEVVGGLIAGSLAVLSDAAHLFSDLASFAIAIIANYYAGLPSTAEYTYGFKKSESLAALFSMTSLALVCVWLGVEAVQRLYIMLFDPELAKELYEVDGRLMSGIATIGVMVNLALASVLGGQHIHLPGGGDDGGGHSHSHDHGHEQTTEETSLLNSTGRHGDHSIAHSDELTSPEMEVKADRNVNLQAAYLHVLGDLAQSVAVLVAGIVIWIRPAWIIVDPICTLGFCVVVFKSTIAVVQSSVAILLEGVPPEISYIKVRNDLMSIQGLSGLHDMHIWGISAGEHAISFHAAAANDDCGAVLTSISKAWSRRSVTERAPYVADWLPYAQRISYYDNGDCYS